MKLEIILLQCVTTFGFFKSDFNILKLTYYDFSNIQNKKLHYHNHPNIFYITNECYLVEKDIFNGKKDQILK